MSKFKVWIDTPTSTSVLSTTDFASDSQRANGFKAGTAASARRVNSALRQANLVAAALVDALGMTDSDNYDLNSSVDNLTTWFRNTNLFKLTKALNINDFIGLYPQVQLKTSIVPERDKSGYIGDAALRFEYMHADRFYGRLIGNANSATSATNDGNGNNIANTYAAYADLFIGSTKTSSNTWTSSYIDATDYEKLIFIITIKDVFTNTISSQTLACTTAELMQATSLSTYVTLASQQIYYSVALSRSGNSLRFTISCNESESDYELFAPVIIRTKR